MSGLGSGALVQGHFGYICSVLLKRGREGRQKRFEASETEYKSLCILGIENINVCFILCTFQHLLNFSK